MLQLATLYAYTESLIYTYIMLIIIYESTCGDSKCKKNEKSSVRRLMYRSISSVKL